MIVKPVKRRFATPWLMWAIGMAILPVFFSCVDDERRPSDPSESHQRDILLHNLWLQGTVSSETALIEEARRQFLKSPTNDITLVLLEKLGQGGIDAAAYLANVTLPTTNAQNEPSFAAHLLNAAQKQSAANACLHLVFVRGIYETIEDDPTATNATHLWALASYLSQKRPVGREVWEAQTTESTVLATQKAVFRLYRYSQGGYLLAEMITARDKERLVFSVLPSEMVFLTRILTVPMRSTASKRLP